MISFSFWPRLNFFARVSIHSFSSFFFLSSRLPLLFGVNACSHLYLFCLYAVESLSVDSPKKHKRNAFALSSLFHWDNYIILEYVHDSEWNSMIDFTSFKSFLFSEPFIWMKMKNNEVYACLQASASLTNNRDNKNWQCCQKENGLDRCTDFGYVLIVAISIYFRANNNLCLKVTKCSLSLNFCQTKNRI